MSDDAIDMTEVMERVQDDKELLMELLQIFLEDFTDKRKTLQEAVSTQNFEEVKSIGHSMKGASGNISAKKLRLSFIELEQMGKTQNLSQAGQVLSAIDEQMNELKDFIEKKLKK